MVGVVYPASTAFLRMAEGEARRAGRKYELSTSVGGGNPIVRSETSGKWFVLRWEEIVEFACEAGIDAQSEGSDDAA